MKKQQPMVEIKAWGIKHRIFFSDSCTADVLQIKKGGYSSHHKHHQKFNKFYLITGELRITIEHPKKNIELVLNQTCRECIIAPNVKHRFEALTDVEVVEISFCKINENDIIRYDESGVKSNSQSE